jgi:hypothetical protein
MNQTNGNVSHAMFAMDNTNIFRVQSLHASTGLQPVPEIRARNMPPIWFRAQYTVLEARQRQPPSFHLHLEGDH